MKIIDISYILNQTKLLRYYCESDMPQLRLQSFLYPETWNTKKHNHEPEILKHKTPNLPIWHMRPDTRIHNRILGNYKN